MINILQQWWREYRRRRALRQIRDAFAFFGYVLDATDAQLEDACLRIAGRTRTMGLTIDEAARAFHALTLAMMEADAVHLRG